MQHSHAIKLGNVKADTGGLKEPCGRIRTNPETERIPDAGHWATVITNKL